MAFIAFQPSKQSERSTSRNVLADCIGGTYRVVMVRVPTPRLVEHDLRENVASISRALDMSGGIVWPTTRAATLNDA